MMGCYYERNEHGEWENKNKTKLKRKKKKHGKKPNLTLILSASSLPNVFLFLLLISRSPSYVLVTYRLGPAQENPLTFDKLIEH